MPVSMNTIEQVIRNNPGQNTALVAGLSGQVIVEMNRHLSSSLELFRDLNASAPDHVNALLQPGAKQALARAIASRNRMMVVSSAYRTCVQQHFLSEQKRLNGVGTLVAKPGTSAHESGMALDIEDALGWRPFLELQGWEWLGDDDPVHFTYLGPGNRDLDTLGVKAFQTLWNRENPEDAIDADGDYGPQTARRMNMSPAGGFGSRMLRAQDPPLEGPDVIRVQRSLLRLALLSEGALNGLYDSATVAAVRAFQERESLLPVDGVAGPMTIKALALAASKVPDGTTPPPATTVADTIATPTAMTNGVTPSSSPGGTELELLKGDSASSVRTLRHLLGLPASSVFDDDLETRVKNFQRDSGLKVDGRVGPRTWAALTLSLVATATPLPAEKAKTATDVLVFTKHSNGVVLTPGEMKTRYGFEIDGTNFYIGINNITRANFRTTGKGLMQKHRDFFDDILDELLRPTGAGHRTVVIGLEPPSKPALMGSAIGSPYDYVAANLDMVSAMAAELAELQAKAQAGGKQLRIYIRYASEMNDRSAANLYAGQPDEYALSFRRVREIFRSKAKDALFAFSPALRADLLDITPAISRYWPGPDVVDVIGGTWYVGERAQFKRSVTHMNFYIQAFTKFGKPFGIDELGGREVAPRKGDPRIDDVVTEMLRELATHRDEVDFAYVTAFAEAKWGAEDIHDPEPGSEPTFRNLRRDLAALDDQRETVGT